MEFKLLMEYNPESPSGLSWIETKYSGEYGNILVHKIGDMVGTLNTTKPYWRFTRQNKAYSCHRVICHLFNMFDYYDYSLEVDHINGDSTCNLIENLRVVDRKTNAKIGVNVVTTALVLPELVILRKEVEMITGQLSG